MRENFLAALGAVLPMALLMALGAGTRRAGVVDRPTMRSLDKLTFRLFMPVLLFKNIYETDLSQNFDPREILFVVLALAALLPLALLLPRRLEPDPVRAATIGHAMMRTNYLLFGVTVAESIYGEGRIGSVALVGAVAVPITNALGVVILESGLSGRTSPGKLALSILKNPMVLATLAALGLMALPVRLPALLWGVIRDLAGVTTTLSFISLGEARANRRRLAVGTGLRTVLVPLVFLPLAVALGFRGQSLCALMVLFAAPTAVASYPMAVAMGADGPLAGQLVCATTVLSVFTMFCCTFLFQSLGLL